MLQEAIDPFDRARRLGKDFAEGAAHFDVTGQFPFENFTRL
ncbi:hypothetical protein FHX15_006084, partial [Rhizobium sp. BK650]|nr:hypothetical protein [Rhizobium sp. BK650]